MYKVFGEEFVNYLDGIFAFVLYDVENDRYLVARDAIGVTTLYYGYNNDSPDTYYIASEMKCLNDICENIISFPPGHMYDSKKKSFIQWYKPTWFDESLVPQNTVNYSLIRKKLIKSVKKRLMSEVPYGVLLSGGLDSSLIASIASRETKKMLRFQISENGELDRDGDSVTSSSSDELTEAYWPRLHSFSIGLPDKSIISN